MKARPSTTLLFLLSLVPTSLGAASTAPAVPQRIVSLSLASDEVLLDLLPSCGGNGRLVAVSTFADDPNSSNVVGKAKQIKGRVHSEPETLLKQKPDLVIAASFNRPELVELLRARHIKVIVLDHFSSAEDIALNIATIADAVNCHDPGTTMIENFHKRLAKIPRPQKPLRVVSWSPSLMVMAGGTLFDAMVSTIGHTNAAATAGLKKWPRVGVEILRNWNPDAVISGCDIEDCAALRQKIKNDPAWKDLTSLREDKLVMIPSRLLLTTSHYFAEASELIAEGLRKINDKSMVK